MDDSTLSCIAAASANMLGFSELKPKQNEVIISFLRGQDVLGVLPTGYGKSLCYCCLPHAFDLLSQKISSHQRAAASSIVVIISPLIALVKDQVRLVFTLT